MSSTETYIAIHVKSELVDQLPTDPDARTRVLELGMREWRVSASRS